LAHKDSNPKGKSLRNFFHFALVP